MNKTEEKKSLRHGAYILTGEMDRQEVKEPVLLRTAMWWKEFYYTCKLLRAEFSKQISSWAEK